MTVDYTAKAAQSLAMLTRAGQDVTRTATTAGSYVPGGTISGSSTANTTRKGAVFPFAAGVATVRGMMVESGDLELYLDAEGSVDINDKFTVNGTIYTVVSFEEYSPAGTPVLFVIHLRRA